MCMVYGYVKRGIVRRIVRSLCFAGACVRTRSIALARDSVARSRDPVARTVMDHTGCEAGVGLVVIVAYVLATRTVMRWDCEHAPYACLFEPSTVHNAV